MHMASRTHFIRRGELGHGSFVRLSKSSKSSPMKLPWPIICFTLATESSSILIVAMNCFLFFVLGRYS